MNKLNYEKLTNMNSGKDKNKQMEFSNLSVKLKHNFLRLETNLEIKDFFPLTWDYFLIKCLIKY